jgi:hypothetical protein
MCDFKVERLKLDLIYTDVVAEIAALRIESFTRMLTLFHDALQARYDEFCSEACIAAKAEEFAQLYCAQQARQRHGLPAKAA